MDSKLESEPEPDHANLGQGKSCNGYPHIVLKRMEEKKLKSGFSKSLEDLQLCVNNSLFDFQTNEDGGKANFLGE